MAEPFCLMRRLHAVGVLLLLRIAETFFDRRQAVGIAFPVFARLLVKATEGRLHFRSALRNSAHLLAVGHTFSSGLAVQGRGIRA